MKERTPKKQNFMHGAAILTIGVMIMKVLGAIYKVPLANILGDYGYGLFLATYNVYNIFFTLSTAGLPVALSRLIAEADANGFEVRKEKTFRTAIGTFAVIGILFSSIMFFGNGWLAESYLRKPDAALSVRAMAPAIFLVCLVSAYRGYCQGNGNMIPTTVDEVLEVLFKVISGLIIAGLLVKAGYDLPVASAGAILGVSIGSVVSLGYMLFYKKKHYPAVRDRNGKTESTGQIIMDILRIGIPISLGASIMAILSSLDPGICESRLAAAGFSKYDAGGNRKKGRSRKNGGRRYVHCFCDFHADGCRAFSSFLPDCKRAVSKQQCGRSGASEHHGHRILLYLPGADGKCYPSGFREGKATDGSTDQRISSENPYQLDYHSNPYGKYLWRTDRNAVWILLYGSAGLYLYSQGTGREPASWQGARETVVLQCSDGSICFRCLFPLQPVDRNCRDTENVCQYGTGRCGRSYNLCCSCNSVKGNNQ